MILHCSHSKFNMVVADGLAPNRRQDISSHHVDIGWKAYIRSADEITYPFLNLGVGGAVRFLVVGTVG